MIQAQHIRRPALFPPHSFKASQRQTLLHRFRFLVPFSLMFLVSLFFYLRELSHLQDQFTQITTHYIHSFEPPPKQRDLGKMDRLRENTQRTLAHGTFYFSPHSQQIEIPDEFRTKTSWNEEQMQLLNDEVLDLEIERNRCASYAFQYTNRTTRRRLFWGSLIADESMEVLEAIGTEVYNVFHTVSFIESDRTQNMSPRKMRFNYSEHPTQEFYKLYQLYGPKTIVSVDRYETNIFDFLDPILRESMQREGSAYRWALNGMKPDDVAVFGDADETLTRDFLRALQICDVPEFSPDQDCREPKLIPSGMIFEFSPECISLDLRDCKEPDDPEDCKLRERRWYHPDSLLGKCVDQIGDATLNPPTKREWYGKYQNTTSYHGSRLHGYGRNANFEDYLSENKFGSGHVPYPLWYAPDLRTEVGGNMYGKVDGSPTAYHFHNFFRSTEEIHFKYHTYGHTYQDAFDRPLWELHEDLAQGFDCGRNIMNTSISFSDSNSTVMPIYYLNEALRNKRQELWRDIMNEEELRWGQMKEKSSNVPDWISSKSAVLGLATHYSLDIYKQFIGSLRATGFTGQIILGISSSAPSEVLEYIENQNVTHYVVETAEKCTYNGTIGHDGKIINMQESPEWQCPKDYPDYKITWARFLLFRDWLKKCTSCTDGVMLTDVRDSFFQSDPFEAAVRLKQQAPLMLFEEHSNVTNMNWLTDWPVSTCRNYQVGDTPMLCSGSVMGSRHGILDYIEIMANEFDYWKTRDNCRFDHRGDDQSIHNYLYYTNRFKDAIAISHRTGPIHVIGYQAARINESWENKNAGRESKTWQQWLPKQHGLIDPRTGLILNIDGFVSPQVHQIDRFGSLMNEWLFHMVNLDGWAYNRQLMSCAIEGLYDISYQGDMDIDFDKIRKFDHSPLEKLAEFTSIDHAQYMLEPPGLNHYALLHYLSQIYGDCRHIVDIGTRHVTSALALASNLKTPVWTFDLPESNERLTAFRGRSEDEWQQLVIEVGINITFINADLLTVSDNEFKSYMGTWLIMLDTHHLPYTTPFEIEFFQKLIVIGFRGIMLLDDINLNDEMKQWWIELHKSQEKGGYKLYDLTPIGHATGTGLIDFSGKVKINE